MPDRSATPTLPPVLAGRRVPPWRGLVVAAVLALVAACTQAPPPPPHEARQHEPLAAWIALHDDLADRLEDRLEGPPDELVAVLAEWLDETRAQREALALALDRTDADAAVRAEIRYLDEIQALTHRLVVLRRQIETRLHDEPVQGARFRRLAAQLEP